MAEEEARQRAAELEARRKAKLQFAAVDSFVEKEESKVPYYILQQRLKKAGNKSSAMGMLQRGGLLRRRRREEEAKKKAAYVPPPEKETPWQRKQRLAAGRIQSRHRGRMARRELRQMQAGARSIQTRQRARIEKRRFRKKKRGATVLASVWRRKKQQGLWKLFMFSTRRLQRSTRGWLSRRALKLRRELTKRVLVHMAHELEAKHGLDVTTDFEKLRRMTFEAARLVDFFYDKGNRDGEAGLDTKVSFGSKKWKVRRIRGTKPFTGRLSQRQWREICGDLLMPWKNKMPEKYSYRYVITHACPAQMPT